MGHYGRTCRPLRNHCPDLGGSVIRDVTDYNGRPRLLGKIKRVMPPLVRLGRGGAPRRRSRPVRLTAGEAGKQLAGVDLGDDVRGGDR